MNQDKEYCVNSNCPLMIDCAKYLPIEDRHGTFWINKNYQYKDDNCDYFEDNNEQFDKILNE